MHETNNMKRRSTESSGQKTDPGDEPLPTVPRIHEADNRTDQINSQPDQDEEAQIRAILEMTAPRGERLEPASIPYHIYSSGESDDCDLEEARPTIENPIVAQLAHDDVDDIAALVSERLERRMTERLKQEVEARMALERSNQVMAEQLTANQLSGHPSSPGGRVDIQRAEEATELQDGATDTNFKICGIRRTCWGLILTTALLLILAGLTSTVLHFTENRYNKINTDNFSTPSDPPTLSPGNQSRRGIIMSRIGDLVMMDDGDVFDDQSSYQYKALNWLTNIDVYGDSDLGSLSDQHLIDRYAIAAIYYGTLGQTWSRQLNFLGTASVCRWNNGIDSKEENSLGVYCSDENVTFLKLADNGLKGKLPREITLLVNLLHVNLDQNILYGELPALSSLSSLEVLWLSSNAFEGTMPTEFSSLTDLASLDLEDNNFSGTIPLQWSTLKHLGFLGLRLNDLGGSIPSGLWQSLTDLRFLDLEGNGFEYGIPSELGFLTSLESLYLEKNRLTGELPSEMARLTRLTEFLIYGNREIRGTVPLQFSALKDLKYFWIHDTKLGGSLNDIFCGVPFVQSLSADCFGDPSEIICSCCTQCCTAFGEDCRQNTSS